MNAKADVDRLLMNSFKKLVLTVPVEKITIKDLLEDSEYII